MRKDILQRKLDDQTAHTGQQTRETSSHRRSHSRIERYFCETCGKGFIYNTQRKRHLLKNACNHAKK